MVVRRTTPTVAGAQSHGYPPFMNRKQRAQARAMDQNKFQSLCPSDLLPWARSLLLEAPKTSVLSDNDKLEPKNSSHEPEERLKVENRNRVQHIVKDLAL